MRMIVSSDADRKRFIDFVQGIDLKSNHFVAEFKRYRVRRSISQNSLYWLWLRCIKDETGNSTEDLHEYFSQKYLSWKPKEVLGEEIAVRSRTSELDTAQFTEYLEKIRVEMLEQAIYLPEPGAAVWEEFFTKYGYGEE